MTSISFVVARYVAAPVYVSLYKSPSICRFYSCWSSCVKTVKSSGSCMYYLHYVLKLIVFAFGINNHISTYYILIQYQRNKIDWKDCWIRWNKHFEMDVICDTFDATMCQKKTQSRKHRQRFWSRIDRKRRGPRLMILGMILCGRSSKIADTFCPDGYARPGMRATRLPSNLKAPRSNRPSLSLDDTVLFDRRFDSFLSLL